MCTALFDVWKLLSFFIVVPPFFLFLGSILVPFYVLGLRYELCTPNVAFLGENVAFQGL